MIKLFKIRSKRGAIDPPLILVMLLCAALIVILIVSIFNFAVGSAVKGNAGYMARDTGSLIDVVDAAPETMRASYKIPFGNDGFPKAGSVLLSKDEICVGPHSEDEMFSIISDASVSGWVGGVITKRFISFQRTWKFAGIRWIGRKIPGAKFAGKIGKVIGKRIVKSGPWLKKIGKIIGGKALRLGKDLAQKIGSLFGQGATRSSSTAVATAPTEASGPWGWIAAKAMAITMFIINFIWTDLPIIAMISMGHSTANAEEDRIECYSTTHRIKYAEPANCQPKVTSLPLSALAGDYSKYLPGIIEIPLIPDCNYDQLADQQGGIISESEFCYSCPNYFVSQSRNELRNWEFKILGEDSTDNLNMAKIILLGPKLACSAATVASATAGAICSAGYYFAIIGALYARPDWTVNLFTGANILPREKYYYITFPSRIDIERIYDAKTGENKLTIIHAE